MEGPLSKWTNVIEGWQFRWFLLDENAGTLSYYTSKEKMVKGQRRGCVRLKGAVVGLDDEDDSTFTITVDQKMFHFQAYDCEERDRWIRALESTIQLHSDLYRYRFSKKICGCTVAPQKEFKYLPYRWKAVHFSGVPFSSSDGAQIKGFKLQREIRWHRHLGKIAVVCRGECSLRAKAARFSKNCFIYLVGIGCYGQVLLRVVGRNKEKFFIHDTENHGAFGTSLFRLQRNGSALRGRVAMIGGLCNKTENSRGILHP